MANTLGYYNPVFYAQEALIHLEKALGMAGRAGHRVGAGQARIEEKAAPQFDGFTGQRIVRRKLKPAEYERCGKALQRRRRPAGIKDAAAEGKPQRGSQDCRYYKDPGHNARQ